VLSALLKGPDKVRTPTIDYFLRRDREDVIKKTAAARDVQARLAEYERKLRREMAGISAARDEERVTDPQIPPTRLYIMAASVACELRMNEAQGNHYLEKENIKSSGCG